jgi:hypothetical protein
MLHNSLGDMFYAMTWKVIEHGCVSQILLNISMMHWNTQRFYLKLFLQVVIIPLERDHWNNYINQANMRKMSA